MGQFPCVSETTCPDMAMGAVGCFSMPAVAIAAIASAARIGISFFMMVFLLFLREVGMDGTVADRSAILGESWKFFGFPNKT